ncbi:MAG: cation transporter [Clostridia bacterium]|nr:cation transporter [Clostridia bacterium]
MKKVFKMIDLDCANCAAKMEREIAKIDGVISVNISFLAQKMTLEADDARFDEIAKLAAKACRKVDDECEVVLK